jgi:hypothetical protein
MPRRSLLGSTWAGAAKPVYLQIWVKVRPAGCREWVDIRPIDFRRATAGCI